MHLPLYGIGQERDYVVGSRERIASFVSIGISLWRRRYATGRPIFARCSFVAGFTSSFLF